MQSPAELWQRINTDRQLHPVVADVRAQVDLKQFNSDLSGRQPGCGHLNMFPGDPHVRPHLRTTGGMTDRAPVSS